MMKLTKAALKAAVIALLVLIPATVWSQALDIPDGALGQSYYTAFPVSISVDGHFDDWSDIPYQSIENGPLMPLNPANGGSMQFAVAADMQNLYISLQVKDANIIANQHGEEFWLEDSVEVYINATGDRNLTSYTPGVAQFNFPAANAGRPADKAVIAGINHEQIPVQSVTVLTDDGYAVEAAIPLKSAVWNIVPAQDGRVGFQVQLNGASQAIGVRDMKLSWSNADRSADVSYENPSVFGELIFFQRGDLPPTDVPAATDIPSSTPAAESTPASLASIPSHAPFTVNGSKIYDPDGNVFTVKGVNVSGYNWVWQRSTVADVDLIANCWNFNLVRVNSFLFTGQTPYQQYNNNNNLDEIVNTFTSRGIVVVFEGHDRIGSYYQGGDLDTLVNWFTDLATRYQNNPYVWFDVMNEPGGRKGTDVGAWVDMHGRVIEAIRNTGAENIIIVEGAYGGQDNQFALEGAAQDSAILQYHDRVLSYNGNAFDNVVFSIHTYDLWNQGDDKMADYFKLVHAQGLAMVIGEYGIFTDQDTLAAAETVFRVAPAAGVGRIVWHWDGGDANDLTNEGGGWQINDCQNPTNLSWLGQQVWDDNHSDK